MDVQVDDYAGDSDSIPSRLFRAMHAMSKRTWRSTSQVQLPPPCHLQIHLIRTIGYEARAWAKANRIRSNTTAFRTRQVSESEQGHTSSQSWWNGPMHQLDATDSVQRPMPLESDTVTMAQQATQQSESSGQASGSWGPNTTISEIIGAIMDIHNKFKKDSLGEIISQSDVERCGQKWSLMYDSTAAVSVATPSFAPHVPLQPNMGDQELQSVTAADIKTHDFRRCTTYLVALDSESIHHL
eukprot:2477307-Amphidinium_carterae.4